MLEPVRRDEAVSKRLKKKEEELGFDKYKLYKKSVQSPDIDVKFFKKTYKELKGKEAKLFREDFCGTFSLCCEWSKLDPQYKAIGVDLDPEPIEYGFENYFSKLKEDEQKRIEILNANVLDPELPKAHIIAALNFSYFIFKERELLKAYFQNCYNTLKKSGILLLDAFGGSQCMEANEEETEHDGFSYFWDQDSYDPLTNYAQFYIHFKQKGSKKREKVFSYDWRMWSLPELKDILEEVGFEKVHFYWEGTTDDGEGDGNFKRVTEGEECEAWVAYIAAEKAK